MKLSSSFLSYATLTVHLSFMKFLYACVFRNVVHARGKGHDHVRIQYLVIRFFPVFKNFPNFLHEFNFFSLL